MHIHSGASVQQLEACEARLGVPLPWQVWMLLLLQFVNICIVTLQSASKAHVQLIIRFDCVTCSSGRCTGSAMDNAISWTLILHTVVAFWVSIVHWCSLNTKNQLQGVLLHIVVVHWQVTGMTIHHIGACQHIHAVQTELACISHTWDGLQVWQSCH